MDINKQAILEAYSKIQSYIHRTPLMNNHSIDHIISANVYFKCQNLQKTGSFKVRGAANKILSLKSPSILCAHSSGNHAQAVAYIAQQLSIRSIIVMPKDTPQVKKKAVRQYGAQIHESGPTAKQQQQLSHQLQQLLNAQLIHPYNDLQIIAGAATIAMEVYQEVKDFDYIVFPIGGGGLTSGTLLSTLYFSPKTIPIGVEPYLARDAYLSLQSGQIQPQFQPLTLAEGVRTGVGQITFSIMKRYLKDIILVTEKEMIDAAQVIMERTKMVVQLSSSIVLAAIIKDSRFRGKKVCAIISGGNMDMSSYFNTIKSSL